MIHRFTSLINLKILKPSNQPSSILISYFNSKIFIIFIIFHLDDAPTLLETFPLNQVIESDVSISLKCIATGSPLPQVTWSLDSQPIPDDNRYRIGDYVTSGGLLVSYVNITSAKVDHGGK